MIRPISLKGEDECHVILFKNRRTELSDIPIEYIESIVHDVNTYSVMSMSIPSKVTYKGKNIDYHLYDEIKAKMFVIVDINGEKQKFIIDDDYQEVEEKSIKYKKMKAYSYEKSLEKKSFINGEGLTRQLYRSKDETVEISDGILNLFEQHTNWKVNYVDFDAQKDLGLYMDIQEVPLVNNLDVEKVTVNSVLWSRLVSISVGEKPLNLTIVYPNMESYLNGQLQKRENITHTFESLPYGVTKIEAKYTSDDTFRFGLTYTFTYSNGKTQEFKRSFSNIKDMRVIVKGLMLSFETGEYSEKHVTKYRYFEQGSTFWYNFLMNDVAKAFDCVFVFDSYKQEINCYAKSNFGEYKGLNMNYENSIKSISKTHKTGEIVTNLTVVSPNVSIASENPLGGETIENYSYYINSGIMSDELSSKLKRYGIVVDEKQIEFLQIKLDKNTVDQHKSKKESELKSLQERLKAENALLTAYIKAQDTAKQKTQSQVVTQLEKDIEVCLASIQTNKDESQVLQDKITAIGVFINKENVSDNQGKIFNSEDLDELSDYIVEGTLENDYYTLAYSLFQHAEIELEKMNSVYIEFVIETFDFLSKLQHPEGWQYLLGIGDKIELDDMDIHDSEGFVQLYGYTYYPNENKVGALKFTNNKEPISAMRTIGDIGRKVQTQTTMTDFYKDVWKDSKNNNVAVSDIIENGLDVASQIVRGRGTVNKIDITESGIYIIDSANENKQIYLGSGLISITEDKWSTSKLAVTSEGVIANVLTGSLILGEKMNIGNADNTVTILPDGIRIFDQKSSKEERIFIGIETVNGVKQARLRLHSANDSSKLVLSEQGIYSGMPMVNARDNFDIYNPFEVSFYIPENFQRIDKANLRFKLEHFRGYTKSAQNASQNVVGATVSTSGGYGKTSSSNGGYNRTYTSGNNSLGNQQTVTTSYYTPGVGGNHTHTVRVPLINHNHSFSVSIPSHNHSFDINSHGHSSSITIPGHGHSLVHGIYQYGQMAQCKIYVDNILVMDNVGGSRDINILSYLKYTAGWHTIKIESKSTTGNTQGLARAVVDCYLAGFIAF